MGERHRRRTSRGSRRGRAWRKPPFWKVIRRGARDGERWEHKGRAHARWHAFGMTMFLLAVPLLAILIPLLAFAGMIALILLS